MEDWLELGRLIHVVLGVFWVAVVLLTVLAICRLPKPAWGVDTRNTHIGKGY